jgi:hypothetical protein
MVRNFCDAIPSLGRSLGGREAEPAEAALKGFEQKPLSRAFAVQLVQRLREQDPKVTPALLWLDRRLLAQGTTADESVRAEHHGQGAMNVTVRNVITSMRLMSAVDWAEFFESVSHVDAVLRAGSDFAAMDFPTRDRYRHAIEEARGTPRSKSPDVQSRPPSAQLPRARTATAQLLAVSMIPAITSSRGDVPRSRRSSDFVPPFVTGLFAPTPLPESWVISERSLPSARSFSPCRCSLLRSLASADGLVSFSRFSQ